MLKSLCILFVSVLVLICNFSCSETEEFSSKQLQIQDSLFNEIMVIHDEVMPLTSTLVKRKGLLEREENSNDSTSLLIEQLETAEEAMWDWMYAIKRPELLREKKYSHEKIMDYLNTELNSISRVKKLMINASNDSDQILKYD